MEIAPSGGGGGGMGGYADSVDSMSPRSRGGESWDEPFAPSAAASQAAAAAKLRLMCSYGGHIMPRPHDKTLCYLGGETRIVVVDRHSTLADLHARLSRSLLGGRPFSLKYQLPSEDLDSLISVTTDEDLDNMVEEYDRIVAAGGGGGGGGGGSVGKSSRLRLFLFPAKPESPVPSSSSIGSLLDDSKSETWFVDALNGAMLGRNLSNADSTTSSVNCLLGLDDSNPSPNGAAGIGGGGGVPPDPDHGVLFPRPDSSGKLGGSSRHGGQDVHSVPESPKASSFGSASSTPSLSNLPPIRVRADDRGPDLRAIGAGFEDHFSQMNVSGEQKQQSDAEGFNHHLQYYPTPPPPQPLNPSPLTASGAAATGPTPTTISPTENPNPNRAFSSDDDKSDHGGFRRSSPQQQPKEQQQQQQQQKPNVVDGPISGDAFSRPAYFPERRFPASDPKQEVSFPDAGYRLPVHATDQGYLLQQQTPPPPPLPSMQAIDQIQQQQQQQQQQAQPQFIQANPHVLHHHHAAGAAIPLSSYYQMPIHHPQQQLHKAAHTYNPQVPMYFLPVRQNPAYNNLSVQPNFGDATGAANIASAGKPTMPLSNAVLPSRVAPTKHELAGNLYQPPQSTQLIHLTDPSAQYVSYHPVHHHPSQAAMAPTVSGYGYEYADAVHAQQLFYTQATSAGLPSQYQTISSGAVMTESPPASQQPTADVKQTRAS